MTQEPYVKISNIIKLEKKIQLLHRKLANIRKNYLHQTTTEIVKTKPFKVVVVEDINIKGIMKNRHLSKAIVKQGFTNLEGCWNINANS